jgi:hypothetical protein
VDARSNHRSPDRHRRSSSGTCAGDWRAGFVTGTEVGRRGESEGSGRDKRDVPDNRYRTHCRKNPTVCTAALFPLHAAGFYKRANCHAHKSQIRHNRYALAPGGRRQTGREGPPCSPATSPHAVAAKELHSRTQTSKASPCKQSLGRPMQSACSPSLRHAADASHWPGGTLGRLAGSWSLDGTVFGTRASEGADGTTFAPRMARQIDLADSNDFSGEIFRCRGYASSRKCGTTVLSVILRPSPNR